MCSVILISCTLNDYFKDNHRQYVNYCYSSTSCEVLIFFHIIKNVKVFYLINKKESYTDRMEKVDEGIL